MGKASTQSGHGGLRALVTVALGLLPHSSLKLAALRRLCGWEIGQGCYIGPCLFAGVSAVHMADGSGIGPFNVFRHLVRLDMGERASIKQFNWISAMPEYKSLSDCCALVMGEEADITSWHGLDCSGGLVLEDFSVVGGRNCSILTHQLNYKANVVFPSGVRLRDHVVVMSNVVIAPGTTIAPSSIVGLGSVVYGNLEEPFTLYAGNPATAKKAIDGERLRTTTPRAAKPA